MILSEVEHLIKRHDSYYLCLAFIYYLYN